MSSGDRSPARRHRAARRAVAVLLAAGAAPACSNLPAVFTQLLEARRLQSQLHVEFTKAAEASNRAVMEETEEPSVAAAKEARLARQHVERDTRALRELLQSLRYSDDLRLLDAFAARFDEYLRLDEEVLPLAVENTNVRAQQVAFGPARAAAEEFRRALDAAVGTVPPAQAGRAAALATRAYVAVLEIRVLQPPHIAESDEGAMTAMERQMDSQAADARRTLEELKAALGSAAAPHLAAASAALDRFLEANSDIVKLSRRNSNVRSLALALGRKRMVTAQCEEHLQALEQALARHEFTATR